MNRRPILIFPGLDGTDRLLQPFLDLAPKSLSVEIKTLPDDPTDDYDSLCARFAPEIRAFESCHLIAESFSGPLGILLAHQHPGIVRRLTLVNSFAVSPAPLIARVVPWSMLVRWPMPVIVAKYFFVGADNSLATSLINATKLSSPKTLAKRIDCLMKVDVTQQLAELIGELHYILATNDRFVSKRSVRRILNSNSNVAVSEIEGPHLILQTRPQQAWTAILDEAEHC